jgi:hypothetical protein
MGFSFWVSIFSSHDEEEDYEEEEEEEEEEEGRGGKKICLRRVLFSRRTCRWMDWKCAMILRP